jgi:hypothetical protein
VILFECLSGQPLFHADTPVGWFIAHLNEAPPRIDELAGVPPSMGELVGRMLAKDRAARPADMDEVLQALRRVRVAPTSTFLTAATVTPPVRRRWRRPAAVLSGVAFVGAIAGGAWLGLFHPAAHRAATPVAPVAVIAAPSRPAPAPEPRPPAPPPPAGSVRLMLRTVPGDADVLLDGQRLPNPYAGRVPLGRRQILEVHRRGFRSRRLTLSFDEDVDRTITLRASPATARRSGRGILRETPEIDPSAHTKPRRATDKNDDGSIYRGTKGPIIDTYPSEK